MERLVQQLVLLLFAVSAAVAGAPKYSAFSDPKSLNVYKNYIIYLDAPYDEQWLGPDLETLLWKAAMASFNFRSMQILQKEIVIGDRFYSFVVNCTGHQMQAMLKSSIEYHWVVYEDLKYFKTMVQTDAPWNLERLSQEKFSKSRNYTYSDKAGDGVEVYLLDTIVNTKLAEFENRVKQNLSFIPESVSRVQDSHGTSLAALIASKTFGVAKKATISSLPVLNNDGLGTTGSFLKAFEHIFNEIEDNPTKKRVILFAAEQVDGLDDYILNQAVHSLTLKGVPMIVAAGNSARATCEISPAKNRDVLTVGALDFNDRIAYFSNFDRCVNIWAPGEALATIDDYGKKIEQSGTSGSAALVAGIMALVLAEDVGFFVNVRHLYQFVVQGIATEGVQGNLRGGSQNILAQNGNLRLKQIEIPRVHNNFDFPICSFPACLVLDGCRC